MPIVTETTDAAAGISTSYAMAIGDYFFGTLGTTGDSDWIRVDLTAGQTYTFGLVGVGALTDNLDDSYLRLRNSAGSQIASDDDDGPGRNSNLTFTATSTGTYYLDVQSWNNTEAGNYGLSATVGSKASYDVTMGAGVLLRPDVSWAASPGTGVTVTWGIRATGPGPGGQAYDAEGNTTAYIVPSAAQIAAAQDVMSMFDGISGLNLVQVNPGGTTNSATMLIGAYDSSVDGAGAFAYYPGNTASSANAGDLWLNNNSVSQSSLPTGSFSYFAILHELGHAVGLAHPGDYNAAPGVSITYGKNAQFIEDTHQYTVMSYFDESNTTSSFSSYPDTLLLYDIYALHQQYGADYSFHAGNTTYGFNATVGGAYDFTTNTNPVLSIWDGSGIDTLDLSGYSMAQLIDLGEGRFSNIGGLTGNLSIAIGAVIENAIGGSGNDSIIGNQIANVMDGNSGNDTLQGGTGNDLLRGGAQEDLLRGDAGNDTLQGGAGNDLLRGGAQEDLLRGDAGNDTLLGEAGFDRLEGGIGDDLLDGGAQADNLLGDAGDDVLMGGGGFDRLFGGDDDDLAYGGSGPDALFGQLGNDSLYGQNDDDRLLGGTGNDLVDGGMGNDELIGGAGFDTLLGSTGNDRMTGAFNADTFVFADFGGGFGQDTITDFDASNALEKIDLARVGAITSYADLTNAANPHMTQVGADVVIDDFGGNTITLLNTNLGDLDSTDFIF